MAGVLHCATRPKSSLKIRFNLEDPPPFPRYTYLWWVGGSSSPLPAPQETSSHVCDIIINCEVLRSLWSFAAHFVEGWDAFVRTKLAFVVVRQVARLYEQMCWCIVVCVVRTTFEIVPLMHLKNNS